MRSWRSWLAPPKAADPEGNFDAVGRTAVPGSAAAHGDGFAATERAPDGTPWTGVVHDENARLMSGAAGHAGLDGCRSLGWVRQGDPYDILRGT